MKTIAQQIKWDFKTNGTLEIYDKNDKLIYLEFTSGFWEKREYDQISRQLYSENSNGFWEKWEWDSQGRLIYFENSNGKIIDNRPKPCENKEIVIDGEKFKLVKV